MRLSSKHCFDLGYLIVAWTIGTYKETCQLNEFNCGRPDRGQGNVTLVPNVDSVG